MPYFIVLAHRVRVRGDREYAVIKKELGVGELKKLEEHAKKAREVAFRVREKMQKQYGST